VGALWGLALFFGVVFAVRFFHHGNVALGVLAMVVAATPVGVLVYGAVRNRRRSLPRADEATQVRRRTLLVLGAGVVVVLAAALLVLTW
jgi:hypothetical protein